LSVLCHAELISDSSAGASGLLTDLFNTAVSTIASFKGHAHLFHAETLFQLCEATLDISSFSSSVVCSFFAIYHDDSSSSQRKECLEVLTEACIQGYKRHSSSEQPHQASFQWTRLRASLFSLLKMAQNPDLLAAAAGMLQALIQAECESIHKQCRDGPSSTSALFHDDVVSVETVPAGIFVRVIGEVVHAAGRVDGASLDYCLQTLTAIKDYVLPSILLSCSEPTSHAFEDPRPCVLEAWLLTLIDVVDAIPINAQPNDAVLSLLNDSMVTVTFLLLFKGIGKSLEERSRYPGMSLDGPQSLALTDFVARFLDLGPDALSSVALALVHMIPVEFPIVPAPPSSQDTRLVGCSILAAALLRAAQGGLPPWAVESIPEVYRSLYHACGSDPFWFGQILDLASIISFVSSDESRSSPLATGWPAGERLAGRFFANLSDASRQSFVQQSMELCAKDDATHWRRFKVLVKQMCGGKKRETDYKQKPAATKWEFERILERW